MICWCICYNSKQAQYWIDEVLQAFKFCLVDIMYFYNSAGAEKNVTNYNYSNSFRQPLLHEKVTSHIHTLSHLQYQLDRSADARKSVSPSHPPTYTCTQECNFIGDISLTIIII